MVQHNSKRVPLIFSNVCRKLAARIATLALATAAGTSAVQAAEFTDEDELEQVAEPLLAPNGQVTLGPSVGRGLSSDGAEVEQVAGYTIGLEKLIRTSSILSVAPRIEATNSIMSTRRSLADGTELNTNYDHRIIAVGATFRRDAGTPRTFAQGVYLSLLAGRSFSRASLEATADTAFESTNLRKINGDWFSGEIGTWIPLRENFGINAGIQSTINYLDQGSASGTLSRRATDGNGGVFSLNRSANAEESGIPDRVVQKTNAIKLGLVLGF